MNRFGGRVAGMIVERSGIELFAAFPLTTGINSIAIFMRVLRRFGSEPNASEARFAEIVSEPKPEISDDTPFYQGRGDISARSDSAPTLVNRRVPRPMMKSGRKGSNGQNGSHNSRFADQAGVSRNPDTASCH